MKMWVIDAHDSNCSAHTPLTVKSVQYFSFGMPIDKISCGENFMTIRPQEKCVLNANSLIKRDMFQLILEGTRGWTSASDIGIDDIVYTHGGACPDAPTPVPGVTDDFYCGFEDEDSQCGLLKNVSSANRDWYIMWKSEFILLIHYFLINSFLSIYI